MQYANFLEVLAIFPTGRYIVNSLQLRDILAHAQCQKVSVRVLHIGTLTLDLNEVIRRLSNDSHPRMDNIKITCLDGDVIIDEPYLGH